MASVPIGPMAAPVTLPGELAPMPALARILSRFERGELASFIAVAIDLLDAFEGDPDCENDDPDTGVEDGPKGFDPEEDLCLAGDHGCGPVTLNGALHWGSGWEDGDCEGRLQPLTLNPC